MYDHSLSVRCRQSCGAGRDCARNCSKPDVGSLDKCDLSALSVELDGSNLASVRSRRSATSAADSIRSTGYREEKTAPTEPSQSAGISPSVSLTEFLEREWRREWKARAATTRRSARARSTLLLTLRGIGDDGEPSTDWPCPTLHDLRHTAASLAISAGVNVQAVQTMSGISRRRWLSTRTRICFRTTWRLLRTRSTKRLLGLPLNLLRTDCGLAPIRCSGTWETSKAPDQHCC